MQPSHRASAFGPREGSKSSLGDTQAAPVSKEVDMIDWLLDVMGFGQAEPGDEPEAGLVLIIDG